MCKISPNLKLCTCAVKDPSTLKNYWILQRPYDGDTYILGTIVEPYFLDLEDEQQNHETLLKALNSGDCFDVVLDVKEKDILDLHFNCEGMILFMLLLLKMVNGVWVSMIRLGMRMRSPEER